MTTPITKLTADTNAELKRSMDTLSSDIARVEGELDLELENLRDLLDNRNPEVARQLEALNGSIQQLHSSLTDVRDHLAVAQTGSSETHQALETTAEQIREEAPRSESKNLGLSPSEAEHERHPDHVTLGSILRALLMADEPAQRHSDS